MAAILLGYFGTMVTAFAVGMFFLASILDTATVHHPRLEAYRMTAAARAMAAERTASVAPKQAEIAQAEMPVLASSSVHQSMPPVSSRERLARVASAKQTQKAKLMRLAREERRRERQVARRQDRGYSTAALGYAAESPTRLAAERIFNTIRSPR